jgi:hypothetical protein
MRTAIAQLSEWTAREREQIGRLEAICESTQHWTVECTRTDVGDPWCIIRDAERHSVVVHVLRMDGRYVAVWPQEHRSANMASIEGAVDRVVGEIASRAA